MDATSQGRTPFTFLRQTALPMAAILLPTVGLIVLLCLGIPLYLARDTRGAPHRRAEADVTAVVPVPDGRTGDPYSEVTLRLPRDDVVCVSYLPLRVGDRVRVDYRQGRSGRVYVSDLERVGPRP